MVLTLIPPRDLAPAITHYRIDIHTQHCTKCNTKHTHSELYAVMPARGGGTTATRLRGPGDLQYNLPIKVIQAPTDITGFCHECYTPGLLSHLPPKPKPQESPAADLRQMDIVKKAPKVIRYTDGKGNVHYVKSSEDTPKPATRKFTVDDL